MILDAYLQFSNAQTLVQAVGTVASTNVVDWGEASGVPTSANGGGARDMGIGTPLWFVVQIITSATSGGAGTLQITLQGAVDNGSGAPGSFTSWWSSPAYALATLNAGSRLYDMAMPRPPDGIAVPRFTRLLYTVGTADLTGGTISSYLVLNRDDQMYNSTDNSVLGGYAAGITVAN